MSTVKAIAVNINIYSEMDKFIDETDTVKLDTKPIMRYIEKIALETQLSVKQRVKLFRMLHQVRRK